MRASSAVRRPPHARREAGWFNGPVPARIRDATEGDAAGVAGLLAELGYPASPEAARERLRQWTADPASRVLVAEGEDGIVGLVATHLARRLDDDRPSCRIADVVVAGGSRRAGVGVALVEAAEGEARRHGATGLELSSEDWRSDAHGFYTRLGFESPGRSFVKRLA
jgi:GNAT superfamily N-acetyltransferase